MNFDFLQSYQKYIFKKVKEIAGNLLGRVPGLLQDDEPNTNCTTHNEDSTDFAMTNRHKPDTTVDNCRRNTILAYQQRGKWYITLVKCEPDRIASNLPANVGPNDPWRTIPERPSALRSIFDLAAASAEKAGWQPDFYEAHWYPPEEEVAVLPGTPTVGAVDISLDSIISGLIFFAIRSGTTEVMCCVDYLVYDDFGDCVRFAQALHRGSYPHYLVREKDQTYMITQHVDNQPDKVRFWIEGGYGEVDSRVDVIVDRNDLMKEFQRLFREIEQSDYLAPMYILDDAAGDEERAVLYEAADDAWRDAVASGTIKDDSQGAEAEFVCRIINEQLVLTPGEEKQVTAFREMLRTGWKP